MHITSRHWAAAGIGFFIAILAFFGWTYRSQAPTPPSMPDTTATTTESGTLVEPVVTTTAVTKPFPINAADMPVSWSFKGAYTGNDALISQANADIAHLTALIGKGQYDDYDLYLGIGNDNNSLGNGKISYENYNRAIAIHPNKGLTFVNLAYLMDNLGAYHTAADAYTKAVTVEPRMLEYHLERLNYLVRQFGTDNARITAAFGDATKQFGDAAPILTVKAQWLTEQKLYADARKVWETVKTLSSGSDTSAIDVEIARLQAKL